MFVWCYSVYIYIYFLIDWEILGIVTVHDWTSYWPTSMKKRKKRFLHTSNDFRTSWSSGMNEAHLPASLRWFASNFTLIHLEFKSKRALEICLVGPARCKNDLTSLYFTHVSSTVLPAPLACLGPKLRPWCCCQRTCYIFPNRSCFFWGYPSAIKHGNRTSTI